MFSYYRNGEFVQDDPTTESLGPGGAPFGLLCMGHQELRRREGTAEAESYPPPQKVRQGQETALLCRCQAGSAASAASLRKFLLPNAITAVIHPAITMADVGIAGNPGVRLVSKANLREPENSRAAAA